MRQLILCLFRSVWHCDLLARGGGSWSPRFAGRSCGFTFCGFTFCDFMFFCSFTDARRGLQSLIVALSGSVSIVFFVSDITQSFSSNYVIQPAESVAS